MRQDMTRITIIREKFGIAPSVEKMIEYRLKWFGHVCRKFMEAHVERVGQMKYILVVKDRGKLIKTTGQIIKRYLEVNDLSLILIHNRELWCCLILGADFT